MIIRGVGSTVLGLALVLGVAACDDNPLSEGRESGSYFRLNPTNTVVQAGDTTRVIATVMNRYGAPTNAPVTAEPCDSKVTAIADPRRSAFESPETFLVIGNTIGVSCIVVRGGGIVDTAVVRVVAGRIELLGDTLVISGQQTSAFTYRILDAAGQPVTGLDLGTVTFISADTTKGVINAEGVFSARAPGIAPVIVRTTAMGVARADTVLLTVIPGTFDGTISPALPAEGSLLTFTAGTVAFDSDTQVFIDGVQWPWRVGTPTATTLRIATPTEGEVTIMNMGPLNLAMDATIPWVSLEPGDNTTATPRVLNQAADSMWFTVGGADSLDMARLVVPAGGGNYIISLDWAPNNPTRNLDLLFYNAAGTLVPAHSGCATAAARPESCVITLPAGTWYLGVRLLEGDETTARLRIAEGTFTGTVTQSAGRGTQILTFTAGPEAFDADTKVRIIGATDSVTYLNTVGNTVIAAIPYGTPAGTELKYVITNIGTGQLVRAGAFTTTAATPATDTWTGNDDPDTAPTITIGQAIVGTIAQPRGSEEYFKVVVTEAGTYRLQVDWNNGSDVDVYLLSGDLEDALIARETELNPEVGTATLQPGTYYINLYMWQGVAATTTYRVRFTKQ